MVRISRAIIGYFYSEQTRLTVGDRFDQCNKKAELRLLLIFVKLKD